MSLFSQILDGDVCIRLLFESHSRQRHYGVKCTANGQEWLDAGGADRAAGRLE